MVGRGCEALGLGLVDRLKSAEADGLGEHVWFYQPGVVQHDDLMHGVLQLTHIPGPGVALYQIARLCRESVEAATFAFTELFEKVLRQ